MRSSVLIRKPVLVCALVAFAALVTPQVVRALSCAESMARADLVPEDPESWEGAEVELIAYQGGYLTLNVWSDDESGRYATVWYVPAEDGQ